MIKSFYITALFLITLISLSFFNENHKILKKGQKINHQTLDSLKFDDGPYVFITKDSLIEKNIVDGQLQTKLLGLDTYQTHFEPDADSYSDITSIAAFSDLHGQFDLSLKILKNNKIIDDNHDWAYGKGHLVIVGDIFDRGPQVTELLWFVYDLEKQANAAGGKVHYVLGNHEYMIMQNDLRYLNEKYKQTEQLLQTSYDSLYGNQTVLGRWLRSKPTILKINDNIFVHGGISEAFIGEEFDLNQTNQKMRQSLIDTMTTKQDSIYDRFYNSNGPIWYRGYFSEDFKKKNINQILTKLHAKHIIVGHTSQVQITTLFKNKILAVDSSIKLGEEGEILLIENGRYFHGNKDGTKIPL